jgi:hypothetical protein
MRRYATDLAINHETKHILDAVERQDTTFTCSFPHPLPIGMTIFNSGSNLADELGIGHGDLQIRVLLISLESIKVLSHNHLYHMYCRLVVPYL